MSYLTTRTETAMHKAERFGPYRSKVELAWAVFWEELDFNYEYEPKNFKLPISNYLPDFYLSDLNNGIWIECKSQKGTIQEKEKCLQLSKILDPSKLVVLVHGAPSTAKIFDCWFKGKHYNCFFDSRTNQFEQTLLTVTPKGFKEQTKVFGKRNNKADKIAANIKFNIMENNNPIFRAVSRPYELGWEDWINV